MFKKMIRARKISKLKKKFVKQLWGLYYRPYTYGDMLELLKIYGFIGIAILVFGYGYGKFLDAQEKKQKLEDKVASKLF